VIILSIAKGWYFVISISPRKGQKNVLNPVTRTDIDLDCLTSGLPCIFKLFIIVEKIK